MSEYQYYEFRALDRRLTEQEMRELRALTTRAEITPTSLTNEYHWGDFKGDPDKLMAKYFDAHLYSANWGTHRLMFRLPRALLDLDAWRQHFVGDGCDLKLHPEHVVLSFEHNDEDGDWEMDEPNLGDLLPIRDELLNGDLRPLYLGWLCSVDQFCCEGGDVDPDAPEPPVPPGLGKLTVAQQALAEFLRIDPDLLEAATQGAGGDAPRGPTDDEREEWVEGLSADEKEEAVVRLLCRDALGVQRELEARFRKAWAARNGQTAKADRPRRTAGELLAARETAGEERRRREAEQRERARQQREREKAAAQDRRLQALKGKDAASRRQVEALIDTKKPAEYDEAVALLLDLRELAQREGRGDEFAGQMRQLRQRHARKVTLIERLDKAGLPR
jgi:hypothetical protein